MEEASADDLARASAQGTILRIRVNGKVYGSGGYGNMAEFRSVANVALGATLTLLTVASLAVVGVALYWGRRHYQLRRSLTVPNRPQLKVPLDAQGDDAVLT